MTVRKYEREDGTEFAKVIGAGTEDEMNELSNRKCLLLMIPPIKEIRQYVVPVAELLPPDPATQVDDSGCELDPAYSPGWMS